MPIFAQRLYKSPDARHECYICAKPTATFFKATRQNENGPATGHVEEYNFGCCGLCARLYHLRSDPVE